MPEDKAASELFDSLDRQMKNIQANFPLAVMIRGEYGSGKSTLLEYMKQILDAKDIKYINTKTDSSTTEAIVVERLPKEIKATQPFDQSMKVKAPRTYKRRK